MPDTDQAPKTKNKNNNKLIISIAVALIVGGGIGYVIGSNNTESELQAKYNQQIQKLEDDLDTAKDSVSGDVEEGQAAIAEGQQTLESVQAENATLKATIEEQKQKIAELEKQLEEAQGANTPTGQPPTN